MSKTILRVCLISIGGIFVLFLSCREQEQELRQVPDAFEEKHVEMPITNLELVDDYFGQESFEELCSKPFAKVAPNGKKVAFVVAAWKTTPHSFSPDARSVRDTHGGGRAEGIYSGSRERISLKIYIIDSSQRSYCIDFAPSHDISGLYFSTDGTKMAFTESYHRWWRQVYVADLISNTLTSISAGESHCISGDGTKVVFCNNEDIFVANIENNTVMNISTNCIDEINATISEDGKTVTYEAWDRGKSKRCIVNLDEKTIKW